MHTTHTWRHSRTVSLVLYLSLTAALYCYLSLFKNVLVDDAYITLRYVRTLQTNGTWGFFPGYTSNTATSPLNVLLLTLMSLLTGSPVNAVIWLTLIELLVLAYFLKVISDSLALPLFGPIAFVALVTNPWVISTLGLESILLITLVVAAISLFQADRLDAMSIACALLTMTRADGILLPAISLMFVRSSRRRL